MSETEDPGHPVLFFDGVCGLCNRAVDFVLRHDHHARLRLCPLQSSTAERLLAPRGVNPARLETLVLLEGEHLWERSDAVLRMLNLLGRPWSWFQGFRVIPRPLRDWLYNRIAASRYRLFGRRESCRLPSADERARFL